MLQGAGLGICKLRIELRPQFVPVDAGALNAEQDAEVDAGPAGVGHAAVTAALVPREGLDPVQDALPSHAALPWLAG